MRLHTHQKPRRVELLELTIGFRDVSPPLPRIATKIDRQRLRAARRRFERQARWNRRSVAIGLVLGTLAIVVAIFTASPWVRWPLLAAAVLEFGVLPWHTARACRHLRRRVACLSRDLKSGLVGEGDGRVRSLFGLRQVIQDARTGGLRCLSPDAAGVEPLPIGAAVTYRFALRSGLVLELEENHDV